MTPRVDDLTGLGYPVDDEQVQSGFDCCSALYRITKCITDALLELVRIIQEIVITIFSQKSSFDFSSKMSTRVVSSVPETKTVDRFNLTHLPNTCFAAASLQLVFSNQDFIQLLERTRSEMPGDLRRTIIRLNVELGLEHRGKTHEPYSSKVKENEQRLLKLSEQLTDPSQDRFATIKELHATLSALIDIHLLLIGLFPRDYQKDPFTHNTKGIVAKLMNLSLAVTKFSLAHHLLQLKSTIESDSINRVKERKCLSSLLSIPYAFAALGKDRSASTSSALTKETALFDILREGRWNKIGSYLDMFSSLPKGELKSEEPDREPYSYKIGMQQDADEFLSLISHYGDYPSLTTLTNSIKSKYTYTVQEDGKIAVKCYIPAEIDIPSECIKEEIRQDLRGRRIEFTDLEITIIQLTEALPIQKNREDHHRISLRCDNRPESCQDLFDRHFDSSFQIALGGTQTSNEIPINFIRHIHLTPDESPEYVTAFFSLYNEPTSRFSNRTISGLMNPVILKFFSDQEVPEKTPLQYTPIAFVCHHGSSMNAGHYVTYRKEGARWVLYDDLRDSPDIIDETRAIRDIENNACLVLYQKAAPPLSS